MDLMDGMEGSRVEGVTANRRIFRALFFACEAGTLGAWFIFSGGADVEMYYRGILLEPFRRIEFLALVLFLALPIVSYCLRRTDLRLAKVGWATFFGVLMFVAIFRLFDS